MKVLLINGSPHENGCTFTALSEIAAELERHNVESEIVHIGTGPVRGCIACGGCKAAGQCVFDDDACNEIGKKAAGADGIIVGSPVHFAAPAGALCAVLDRMFFSSRGNLTGKPAAAVVSCRRGGASASFDRLNKYFTISQMPVVSSNYWNAVHGNSPEEVKCDLEGLQTMRTLAKNMAWILASKTPLPDTEPKVITNFIR